ncbi:putative DNA-binding protein [Paenibacillus sp. FSL R7-0204]|uniref:putative DNA-binding protein n=1 Tax=Paenibacillus sp. FSL R7-0204 TaxID=2921675 RepID=UPI0030FB0E19
MSQENRLEKTNRINLLFAFYERLLTDKQQTFLKYYFHDDFSLGEIAAEFEISRQAVYEHIKRAEQVLENYEEKLGLLSKHEDRNKYLEELRRLQGTAILPEQYKQRFMELMDRLQKLE